LNGRFIRTPEDDAEDSWEKKIAKKYYDKLFKEYCLGDFSRYKEGKIGLRWRTQKELFEGKGQFVCGNKACNQQSGLRSFEVLNIFDEFISDFDFERKSCNL
jgi:protein FRA10AC1